mgnify:CR=1 FL=1
MIRSLMVLVSVRVQFAVTQCKDDIYNLPVLNESSSYVVSGENMTQ